MSDTRKRPVPLTDDRQALFLAELCAGKTVIEAAAQAGVDRSAFYRHRADDPDFQAAWDEALEHGTDLLEAEAQRRAVEGVEDFKVGPNGQFVEMRRYSDTLLIFLLKARRPDKFRDNATVVHQGPKGGPIQIEDRSTTLHDIARVLAEAQAAPDDGS